jgi:hypothetical protein
VYIALASASSSFAASSFLTLAMSYLMVSACQRAFLCLLSSLASG